MITLDNWSTLTTLLLGGGWLTHVVAGRKNKNDDKQALIDQLQEEREYTDSQLKKRDDRIDLLQNRMDELTSQLQEALHKNRTLEWDLSREREKNAGLQAENEKLKVKVETLETRVSELEREQGRK